MIHIIFFETRQTHLEVSVNDQVLVLDVAVRDSLAIEIVHGLHDLREDISSLILCEPFVLALLDAFEKIVGGSSGKPRSSLKRSLEEIVVETVMNARDVLVRNVRELSVGMRQERVPID